MGHLPALGKIKSGGTDSGSESGGSGFTGWSVTQKKEGKNAERSYISPAEGGQGSITLFDISYIAA